MTYDEQHAALVTYLKAKVEQGDWHAVRDAAVDIEMMEAHPPIYTPETKGACMSALQDGDTTWFCQLHDGHVGAHIWPAGYGSEP